MPILIAGLLSIPPVLLLMLVFVPRRRANDNAARMMAATTGIAATNAIVAIASMFWTAGFGSTYEVFAGLESILPVSLSVYIDGVSSIMLALVASVGWVICRYSVRYLDGESQQGNYFRWTGFTIGSVSVAVLAGNLLLLVAALLMTSIGLHQLLTHYSERPAAKRAASLKFWFSRVGDLCLISAAFLLYGEFGTLEIPKLFELAEGTSQSVIANSNPIFFAGCLLVLCAIFKSAQFPFHTWLPETMEAPTPVSALMHAGIVNAGGYLLIRLGPIVSLTPAAMFLAAGIGAFTALFAALIMLTQTSVKRSLAWSTIAQMGFMILQCGLGAFSAAMLHIVAHSLYKAHAFLSSGSVMEETAAAATTPPAHRSPAFAAASFCVAAAAVVLTFAALASGLGLTLESKPGGFLLGFVLCAGLTRWLAQNLSRGWLFVVPGVVQSAVLIAVYMVSFKAVDFLVVGSAATSVAVSSSLMNATMLWTIAFGFSLLLLLEVAIKRGSKSQWMQNLYVMSSNEFYFDTFWRSVSRSFSS